MPQNEVFIEKSNVDRRKWREIAKDTTKHLSGSGGLLVKSLHLDHDLDEPLALVHKGPLVLSKSLEGAPGSRSHHVAIQTEEEMTVEESLGWSGSALT